MKKTAFLGFDPSNFNPAQQQTLNSLAGWTGALALGGLGARSAVEVNDILASLLKKKPKPQEPMVVDVPYKVKKKEEEPVKYAGLEKSWFFGNEANIPGDIPALYPALAAPALAGVGSYALLDRYLKAKKKKDTQSAIDATKEEIMKNEIARFQPVKNSEDYRAILTSVKTGKKDIDQASDSLDALAKSAFDLWDTLKNYVGPRTIGPYAAIAPILAGTTGALMYNATRQTNPEYQRAQLLKKQIQERETDDFPDLYARLVPTDEEGKPIHKREVKQLKKYSPELLPPGSIKMSSIDQSIEAKAKEFVHQLFKSADDFGMAKPAPTLQAPQNRRYLPPNQEGPAYSHFNVNPGLAQPKSTMAPTGPVAQYSAKEPPVGVMDTRGTFIRNIYGDDNAFKGQAKFEPRTGYTSAPSGYSSVAKAAPGAPLPQAPAVAAAPPKPMPPPVPPAPVAKLAPQIAPAGLAKSGAPLSVFNPGPTTAKPPLSVSLPPIGGNTAKPPIGDNSTDSDVQSIADRIGNRSSGKSVFETLPWKMPGFGGIAEKLPQVWGSKNDNPRIASTLPGLSENYKVTPMQTTPQATGAPEPPVGQSTGSGLENSESTSSGEAAPLGEAKPLEGQHILNQSRGQSVYDNAFTQTPIAGTKPTPGMGAPQAPVTAMSPPQQAAPTPPARPVATAPARPPQTYSFGGRVYPYRPNYGYTPTPAQAPVTVIQPGGGNVGKGYDAAAARKAYQEGGMEGYWAYKRNFQTPEQQRQSNTPQGSPAPTVKAPATEPTNFLGQQVPLNK